MRTTMRTRGGDPELRRDRACQSGGLQSAVQVEESGRAPERDSV